VSLLIAILILVLCTAAAVGAILLVRRGAPEGGYFADGDRAAGVFGVIATGFSVLLGFIIFLAFESYDASRSGGETEALVVTQQFRTAQLLPRAAAVRYSGELVCYARSIVHQEWPVMEDGKQPPLINQWGARLFLTLQAVEPRTNAQGSGYDKLLDQTSDREQARNDRLHAAEGVVPAPLWVVLFLIAGVIFAFMLFLADSGERATSQGMLIGSATAVIVSMLLLLWFFDNPYQSGSGGLRPTAMERTLSTIDGARRILGITVPPPCDERGLAVGS
jgi:amino acid transporter